MASILGVAIVVELLAIVVLVGIVGVFGPSDPGEAEAYAQRLGAWVGPLAGFVLTLGGAWLIARSQAERHVVYGLVLGATVAAIDIILLLESGADFEPVFVLSNIGRLVAGGVGGWLASR